MEGELESMKKELSSTKDELSTTKQELSSAKDELSSSQIELSSTKEELSSIKLELSKIKQQQKPQDEKADEDERAGEEKKLASNNVTSVDEFLQRMSEKYVSAATVPNSIDALVNDVAEMMKIVKSGMAGMEKEKMELESQLESARSSNDNSAVDLAMSREKWRRTKDELQEAKEELEEKNALITDVSITTFPINDLFPRRVNTYISCPAVRCMFSCKVGLNAQTKR